MGNLNEIVVKLTVDNNQGMVNIQYMDDATKRWNKSIDQLSQSVGGLERGFVQSFQNMRNVGQGLTELFSALEHTFGKGIAKAMEYELSVAKLTGALKSSGKDVQMSASDLEAFAAQQSKLSLFSKTDVLNVERYFLTFRNIGKASMVDATEAAMGLSEVLDIDLRAATIALAKALDQGSEGMKALNKMGLKLQADELDHVKQLEEEGKTYEMQSYIIGLLQSKYKDLNEEIQKTDAFKLNQMQKGFADMQKQAGLLQLHALEPLITGLSDFMVLLGELPGPVKGITMSVLELAAAYTVLQTTGIGKSVLAFMQFDFGLKANAIAQAEATFAAKAATEAELQQALASYEVAAATKAFMGPLGWAIIVVGTLATAWGLMKNSVESALDSMGKAALDVGKQKVEYASLAGSIMNVTLSEKERKDAIQSIQEKYPEYLGNKTLDLNNEKQMNDTLKAGNKLFDERIKLKGMENQLQKIADEMAAKQVEIVELQARKAGASTKGGGIYDSEGNEITGAASDAESVQIKINAKQKELEGKQKEYDRLSTSMKPAGTNERKTAEEQAKDLMALATGGLTNEALENLVKELQEADKKLVRGSQLSKQVEAHIQELSGKDRYGKTGGNRLGYLVADAKMDLQNVDSMADIYDVVTSEWAKIDQMKVKRAGKYDAKETEQLQQRGRFKLQETFGREIDTFTRNAVKAAEVESEAEGGGKLEMLEVKLATMTQLMKDIDVMVVKWNADPEHKDFPLVTKQKQHELGNELRKVINEVNAARFNDSQKDMKQEQDLWLKQLDNLKATDLEKLAWKQTYLEAELKMAQEYRQTDKADDLEHQLAMLEQDKRALAEKMKIASRTLMTTIGVNARRRIAETTGASGDYMAADLLEEGGKYASKQDEIHGNGSYSEEDKNRALEDAEREHGRRIIEIRRKYYDTVLGEALGMGIKEIETTSKIFGQIENAAKSMMEMENKTGQAIADSYRTSMDAQMETDKASELAQARTTHQKTDVETKYAKRKQEIDTEANKRAQDQIRTMFAVQKAVQIAQAIISTYSAATAALAPPPTGAGPLMGPILAAATVAAGLANVAVISQQQMPKFATGGWVNGPGHGTSDSIHAMLSNGEFIVNSSAAERNRGLLEMINSGRGGAADMGGLMTEMRNIRMLLASGAVTSQVVITKDHARQITSNGLGGMRVLK